MSPSALLTVLLFHGVLLWLISQHWPIGRAMHYVVYQYVRPAPQAAQAAQEAPASRAITPSRSARAATDLSVFSTTVESSVPLKTTDQLPELAQAKTRKPARHRPVELPPEVEPTPIDAPPVAQAESPLSEPPAQQTQVEPAPQPTEPTVPTPPPPPAPEPAPALVVPAPVPAPTPPPASVLPTPVAPPPVSTPPPVVPAIASAPAPAPLPLPAPVPAPVIVQPAEPVAQPEPLTSPAPAAERPLKTVIDQPRATHPLRGPVVEVPAEPNVPAASSVAVPVLVLPPAGQPQVPMSGSAGAPSGGLAGPAAGAAPGTSGGPSTGPGGSGPSGIGPAAAVGPGGSGGPATSLPFSALPSAVMPSAPASRPTGNAMPPPPMQGTYRVLPQFRRNLADMANEQLRRGKAADPLADGMEGAALPDCTRPQTGTDTVGGLLAAPAVAGRLLSGRCR